MRFTTTWLFAAALMAGLSEMGAAESTPLSSIPIVGHDQIITTTPTPNPVDGSYFDNSQVINILVGADRFYAQGFDGSDATVANIEGGAIWNGHETLGKVEAYINGPGTPGDLAGPGAPGEFDWHATAVGQILAGKPADGQPLYYYQVGIAYNAHLWSGTIATDFGSDGSFTTTIDSVLTTYKQVMVTGITANGVPGRTADVVNSSWGFADPTGANDESRGIDALARLSTKTVVFAAGNAGPGPNTVGSPAAGYNVISVGALGNSQTSPPYNSVSTFSSAGPNDTFVPTTLDGNTGFIVPASRARVDLVAPGEDFFAAAYGGATGSNRNGTEFPPFTGNDQYFIGLAGTSFAAPTVAGGATLLADVGNDFRFLLGPHDTDGRVIKAVLMNSATKTPGWNNGQVTIAGVVRTTQSLDYAAGAGALNLSQAFDQYTAGTFDVPGLGGGTVQKIGWDFGQVAALSPNDYFIDTKLVKGSTFTATLNWFVDRGIDLTTNATTEGSFANLDLEIWRTDGTNPIALVATSDSIYNNTEHLSFSLPNDADGDYMLRVVFTGDNWNLDNAPLSESYALAWSAVAVPEPSTLVLGILAVLALAVANLRRRRLRSV